MSALANSFLRLVKWPVALAALVALPGAVLGFKDEIEATDKAEHQNECCECPHDCAHVHDETWPEVILTR